MTFSHSRLDRESKTIKKIDMNKIFKIAVMALAGAAVLASCQEEPVLRLTDVGPEMQVNSWTESTYMGADIKFSVSINDDEFALSTLKAKLLYDETEVNNITIRTKEDGTYEGVIQAPLYKDIPDGIATLAFASQNVGMGLTYDTVYVSLKRPDFDALTLTDDAGKTYSLRNVGNYKYELTQEFPALVKGVVTTPAINAEGEIISLGWDGSALSVNNENPIPFSSTIPGEYTIAVDLMKLTASPFGYVITEEFDLAESKPEAVYSLRQGIGFVFPAIEAIYDWDLDPDFFTVDGHNVTWDAVDGYYKFQADFKNTFIKVLPCDADGNTLSLNENGEGAVWVIGANFGKPSIGPGWDTTNGAYAMSQVSPKVYQFSLNVGSQINEQSGEIKFFHQMGWGGEFTQANFASFDGAGVFQMTESGNIKLADGAAMTAKKAYRFTLDLTAGLNAAVLKVKEVEAIGGAALDIQVNGVKADKLSRTIYKVKAIALEKGQEISFTGIENPLEWYVDPDHFVVDGTTLKFNAVNGFYSLELNLDQNFVTVRRVKEDGAAATYADEGAITMMGWGVAQYMMTSQLAWETGALITLAEVEDGVYQFTGIAVEESDGETVGGRWRYDYLSYKFFGQAGWGAEQASDLNLTDEAKKYIKQSAGSNIEMADGVTLEKGATYVMTVTDCTPLDGDNKFNCTIDFRKK